MLTTAALVAAGLVTGLLTGPALRRLPEPDGPDSTDKPLYRHLASRRFAISVAVCSMAALLVVAARTEPVIWPAWLPLATIGVFLVAIDAVTTWLPLRLTHLLWAGTAVGLSATVALSPDPERIGVASRIVLGAVLVGGFFWLFWWFAGGIGFGDVRLAPVLGAVAGTISISTVAAGLFAGTVLGAAHGLVRRARGRAGPFPYGPALVLGVFAALIWAG
jgi:leader peptidase (prepilin peptidase)/N-methyltransferase